MWIALAGGAGLFPVAPGTAGAFLGVLLALALLLLLFPAPGTALLPFLVLTLGVTGLGFAVSGAAGGLLGVVDDGRIVIDEVAGQLIALLPLFTHELTLASGGFWVVVVTAFVLFRGFDIAKPGPVGWAERRISGGAGVMTDDLVAGALGAAVLALLLPLFESAGVVARIAGVMAEGASA